MTEHIRGTRAWRQLAEEIPPVDTPAGDSTLRLALTYWSIDARASLTPKQRQWVQERLCPRFTAEEKARMRVPLLAYLERYHPRIAGIVRTQFGIEDTP
jgi:hypothetical protein